MNLSPIALFVYDRLSFTQQTVEALRSNHLAKESKLFIFSDAPKNQNAAIEVAKVREYIKRISGFKKVSIIEASSNHGPSESVIVGVTRLVTTHGKVIVLDDDLVTSPYFLNFMNDALQLYENEEKVISICGYMYPIRIANRETLFLRISDNWGWATWKRGWNLFEPDANKLLEGLKSKKMVRRFDLNGAHACFKMLRKQAQKKISSWAIRWYACALLNNKLSLYPAKSLVCNIGLESGSHCSNNIQFYTDIYQKKVLVTKIATEEDKYVIKKIEMFFRISRFKKIGYIIGKYLFNCDRSKKNK